LTKRMADMSLRACALILVAVRVACASCLLFHNLRPYIMCIPMLAANLQAVRKFLCLRLKHQDAATHGFVFKCRQAV